MTVCARATSWVSALMNFSTTQWVFVIDFNPWDPCSRMYVILCSLCWGKPQQSQLWVKLCIYNDFLITESKGASVLLLSYRKLWAMPLKLDSCDTVIVIFYCQIWALLHGDKIYIYMHILYICMYMCMYKTPECYALSN